MSEVDEIDRAADPTRALHRASADGFEAPAMGGTAEAETYLVQAITLLFEGAADRALVAASEACHRAPDWPQAHYVYGQAWSALGRDAEAERAFAAAIQLAPLWADAWVNYGVARYRQGSVEDAKTAMLQVLGFAPGHPAATANLGAFLRISGGAAAAEQLLSEQLARAPHEIGARLNLAADLLSEERAAEALALLDAVPPPDEAVAFRHWSLQRSLACLQLGRPAEARQDLQRLAGRGPLPAPLAPLVQWRLVLLAAAEGDPDRARREALAMEASLATVGGAMMPEHAVMACFDLAKFWSGQGETKRAFAQWQAGHDRLRRTQPFSRDAHRAFVDATIAAFPAARFRDGPVAANRDAAAVFIVGMPRSGTTLVEQILDAHRDAHGAGERVALGRLFAEVGEGAAPSGIAALCTALGGESLDAMASAYLAELRALAPGAKRIVDKMPGNFNHLGLVGLMLPGARIIHCTRDPRDVGLSIFTFRFHGEHPYAHDLADLGWYIGEHERLMAHWKAVLPNPILTLRLSDWVEDFDGTLARVLAFLDLPPDPNCARFHEGEGRVRTVSRAQVRQPVNARGLGRWRAYADDLAPLIAELERTGSLEGWA